MEGIKLISEVLDTWFVALLLTWPRIHAFLATSQLFAPTSVPRLARTVVIFVLTLPILPVNEAYARVFERTVGNYALHFAKEYVIGFLLGYLVGWIFWVVQSAGALIDNQRGAAIASSIDPLQGHETSPLGNLFSQTFLTYVFVTGAVLPIFGLLYQSYGAWPSDRAIPLISDAFPVSVLQLFDYAMRLTFVLAAPIVAIMFMAEFALAIVSRFAPQVQVFILAMPIKSALAIFILIFYMALLMPYAMKQLNLAPGYADSLYRMLRVGERIWPEISPLKPRPEAPRP
jgi:type III secretion protein T